MTIKRMFRIKHLGETIGYSLAGSAKSALSAFRNLHKIPAGIILTAEPANNCGA